MTTPVSILTNARKLIEHPSGWTKNCFARSKTGRQVKLGSPRACSFCAWGALERVSPYVGDDGAYIRARQALDAASPDGSILLFNDDAATTHKQVLAAFDEAIASLKSAERGEG
jgi:hypothetical protein